MTAALALVTIPVLCTVSRLQASDVSVSTDPIAGYFGNHERVPYSGGDVVDLTCPTAISDTHDITWFGERGQTMEALNKSIGWQYHIYNNHLLLMPPVNTSIRELIVYCVGRNLNVKHAIELYKYGTHSEAAFYTDTEVVDLKCNKSVMGQQSAQEPVTWYANGSLTMEQLMNQSQWQAHETDNGHVLKLRAPEVSVGGPLDLVCMSNNGTRIGNNITLTRIDPENLTLFGRHNTTTCAVPIRGEAQLALTCQGTTRYPIDHCDWYSSNSSTDPLKAGLGPKLVLGRDVPLDEGLYWCRCMVGKSWDVLRMFQVTSGPGTEGYSFFCHQVTIPTTQTDATQSTTASLTSPDDETWPTRIPSVPPLLGDEDTRSLPETPSRGLAPSVEIPTVTKFPDDGGYRTPAPLPAGDDKMNAAPGEYRNVGGTISTTASTGQGLTSSHAIIVAVIAAVCLLLAISTVVCYRLRRGRGRCQDKSKRDPEDPEGEDKHNDRESLSLMATRNTEPPQTESPCH